VYVCTCTHSTVRSSIRPARVLHFVKFFGRLHTILVKKQRSIFPDKEVNVCFPLFASSREYNCYSCLIMDTDVRCFFNRQTVVHASVRYKLYTLLDSHISLRLL
jgi:hypothetical protein